MRVTFEEVKAYSKRKMIIDGKKKYQQKTFVQTINPFNKNEDGTVKTYAEVLESVRAEAKKWEGESNV